MSCVDLLKTGNLAANHYSMVGKKFPKFATPTPLVMQNMFTSLYQLDESCECIDTSDHNQEWNDLAMTFKYRR